MPSTLRPTLALAIKDAILLGNVAEIDAILELVRDDDDFPGDLRTGLDALRHFRAHYGANGVSPPQDNMQKKKTALMEAAWGAELLDMLRRNEPKIAKHA